jgi:hypothetical protein
MIDDFGSKQTVIIIIACSFCVVGMLLSTTSTCWNSDKDAKLKYKRFPH